MIGVFTSHQEKRKLDVHDVFGNALWSKGEGMNRENTKRHYMDLQEKWGKAFTPVGGDGVDIDQALRAADLNWVVERRPVLISQADGNCVEVEDFLANVRSDNGELLGITGKNWTPVQNDQHVELANQLVRAGDMNWVGLGYGRGGRSVHALMELNKDIKIGGDKDEEIWPLVQFRQGHDGGLSVVVEVTPLRLVCINGMRVPVADYTYTWRMKHTSGIQEKIFNISKSIDLITHYYDRLPEIGDQLVTMRVDDHYWEHFLDRLIPFPNYLSEDDSKGGHALTRARNRREKLTGVWRNTENLENIRYTRWGVLQAVCAFYDHHTTIPKKSSTRTPEDAAFERASMPAAIKTRAMQLLLDA